MISSSILARYARALADVALEKGEEQAVQHDLDVFLEIFRQVPALIEALDSPAVPLETKHRVLSELMTLHPVSQTARNFLRILQDHHRIRHFEEICRHYVQTVNERKGILEAKVTSAAPLRESELSSLRAGLSRLTSSRVTLSVETDPNLLAGIVVQIGSTVYDGSVRTQLSEMRRHLSRD